MENINDVKAITKGIMEMRAREKEAAERAREAKEAKEAKTALNKERARRRAEAKRVTSILLKDINNEKVNITLSAAASDGLKKMHLKLHLTEQSIANITQLIEDSNSPATKASLTLDAKRRLREAKKLRKEIKEITG